MNPFRLSYLYLRRHLFTTTVTILALALAIASVTLLLKLEILSHSRFDTLADQGDALVGAKSGGIEILLGALNFEGEVPAYLPQNLYETLKAKKDIQFEDKANYKEAFTISHITPLLVFGTYKSFKMMGTDESLLSFKESPTAPKISEGTFPTALNEILLGADVAKSESLKIGDSIYVHAKIHSSSYESSAFPLKVVGLLQATGKTWDRGIFSNLMTAQNAVLKTPGYQTIWGSHILSYFILNIQPGGEEALATLINQRTVSQLVFVDKEKQHLQELTGQSQTLQLLIVGTLLLLSTLTVLAVFFTRMEARSLELAVLRALGYARAELTQLLLIEGLWMGLVSILVAAIFEAAISPLILATAGAQLPQSTATNWPWWIILVTGLLALVAIAIASLPPLWRLYRQDVHTALRNIS
ncbi:ABC transporter permease [Bdellovibrio svalbardensis]|uniref:FtsX-like permease family protein n=1 Tax=Bdellovibrio svalbardensis TaxID=2972972 RepID=A0ABT6DQG8_9BACT|nr:FtsX-like permease family protein [Bdellovibrio svalbardensis]MDG0817398.1 FtsX-like permease family protein [Bdellovibrio svalbardensis]